MTGGICSSLDAFGTRCNTLFHCKLSKMLSDNCELGWVKAQQKSEFYTGHELQEKS